MGIRDSRFVLDHPTSHTNYSASRHDRHSRLLRSSSLPSSYVPAVFDLLLSLVGKSPESELIFTSDWQFGPDHTLRLGRVTLSEFRALHDSGDVLLNALYQVHAG